MHSGRTIEVLESEIEVYKNVGWYETKAKAQSANKVTNNTTSSNNPSTD